MKRMILVCMIVLSIVCIAKASTYRLWSDASWEWRKYYEIPWHPCIDFTTGPTTPWTPTPWQKIRNDGALWISPTGIIETGIFYIFRKPFYKYNTYDGYRISRATIWIAADTSEPQDYFYVQIGRLIGTSWYVIWESPGLFREDTLHRCNVSWHATENLTELLDAASEGWYQIWIWYKVHDAYTRTIAYMSIDYTQNSTSTLHVDAGWNYISLPMRFVSTPPPTLADILPGIYNPAYILDPSSCSWIPISTTAPLTGSLMDKVNYNTILCLFLSEQDIVLNGYPILEQRYLSYPLNSCMTYPIGGVFCEVPFNWETNQPDDCHDGVVWQTYVRLPPAGSRFLDGDRILNRFEGHEVTYNFAHTPETDNNTHLDLRCYGLMIGEQTDPWEFAASEGIDADIPSLEEILAEEAYITEYPEPAREGEPYMPEEIVLVPPAGYDENGAPLPPRIHFTPFEKSAIAPEAPFAVEIFPNPFNSATEISCNIPQNLIGEQAELAIYDNRGRLVNEFRKVATENRLVFQWDGKNNVGTDVCSGMYHYKMTISGIGTTGIISVVR